MCVGMYIVLMKIMLDNENISGYDLPCCKLKDHFFDGDEAIVRNRSILRDERREINSIKYEVPNKWYTVTIWT